MKRTVIPIIAVVVALAAAAQASAHRRANRAQTAAMVYDASARYYGGVSVREPRSAPLRCFTGVIATVVNGSRWGAWTFSHYADQPSHVAQCRTGNGVVIEHKIGQRWYVLWEGSAGYPPTHDTKVGSFTLKAVPRAVAKDLIAGLA